MRVRTQTILLIGIVVLMQTAGAFGVHSTTQQAPVPGAAGPTAGRLPNYILGPNDEIVVLALDAEEISNKPIRVTTSGDISLPLVGRVHVAGMTIEDVEKELVERLKVYIRQPELAINITQFKSQPVSVFGAVGAPGVVQLEGRRTLIEVLAMAGGLKGDAGSTVKVTRRSEWGAIPLATAKSEGSYSVAEVSIRAIEDASRPEDNIQILPHDVISVARAQVVYVMGEVRKPGGFALNEKGTISLIEALARAEGFGSTASQSNAKIIRPVPGSNRIEIPVNLADVLKGKSRDMMLQPDDILYVPSSYAKGTARRTLDTIISLTTGMLIYR
jgi:polysaccharide biosynthesis/export protein